MGYQRTLLPFVLAASLLGDRYVLSWIAPPYPNSTTEWESVHDMRRRMQQPFNYRVSKYMDAEVCRYLSEEECEEADLMMQQQVEAHKSLQIQVRNNPNLGSINVLVLMIRFTDHVGRDLISKRDIDNLWQTRIPEWFDVNSQGRYDIKATVIDWTTTDNTEKYYSFGKRGTVPQAGRMSWPALEVLDKREGWDWSKYDLDGNGVIDSLVIIHSGYGAETTTDDCFGAEFNNRIWAHAFSTSRAHAWNSEDGSIRVGGYTMASAFDSDCGTVPMKIGLTVHEYMHTMGLVDLYDGVDPVAASGIGAFDIMAYPYGQSDDADNPGHLSVYSKILADWVEPVEISAAGDYTLKASEISDEAYRITLADYGVSAEYLLIENRQPLEFDIGIWAEGLVIYHIDTAAQGMKNLGYPGQPGWPENGNHYLVAVLQKDGLYDLEQGKDAGDAGDFWVPGDCLGPGMGGTVYPNTDLYGSGFIQETGIWLCVKSQSGTDVTFEVGGFDGEPMPTETAVDETVSPTQTPTAAPTTANPTQLPTAAPTTANPTQSPTVSPTVGTPIPTLGTPIPTSPAATASPTQAPSKRFTTFTPTITTAAAIPTSTPSATAVTNSPTRQIPVQTMAPVPFGMNEEMTRNPAYLSSFGEFGGLPTTTSPSTPYLSTFDGSPSVSLFYTNAASFPRPTDPSRAYLSSFGNFSEAQLGPPLPEDDEDGENENIFFSSIYSSSSSRSCARDSRIVLGTCVCWLWYAML